MIKHRWPLVALAVLLAGWVAVAVKTTGGPNPTDYGTTVQQAADGTLGAVRTARLAGQAHLAGQLTDPYLSTVLDDALQDLGDAQRRLGADPPPGSGAAALRDRLAPLVQAGDRTVGDLADAADRGDRGAERTAVDALGGIGDRLAAFVESARR